VRWPRAALEATMHADRYLKVILTIIAAELGWIALTHSATPVGAQQNATPVVITGIELQGPAANDYLPVGILGQAGGRLRSGFQPIDMNVNNDRVPVSIAQTVDVRAIGSIRIDSDRPIKVENVGYTPAQRPGE
jgi:hypothetical protein